MPSVTVKVDFTLLDRLLKRIPENAAQITAAKAEDVVKDIRANWSSHAPSGPGKPPAVVSGQLDASIDVKKANNGRRIDATILIQATYASFLEYGTKNMAARPFVRPAMKRAEKGFRNGWRDLFR